MPTISLAGINSIFRKELIQLMRDPYLVAFIIILPILQLMITGLAVTRDLKHIPTVVYNYDNRSASIELINALNNSSYFDINDESTATSEAMLHQAVREGKYRAGIVIPEDYSEKLLDGTERAKIRVIVDGINANIAKTIIDAAHAVTANHAVEYAQNHAAINQLSPPPIDLETRILYNPELKTSYFLIPAILGLVMHMMTILFTSFSIVRERENGTLEQLMVTPIRVSDLMIGKVLPYAAIGLADMLLTIIVMIWFFEIPITGSFWFLLLASVIFIVTSLGVGLLISTTCRTQVQAIQLTVGLFLPSLLLTGFVFPLEPMPFFIKIISYCLPLTYYLDIIRGVVIKGTGAQELWYPTLIITLMAMLLVGASILRFKKRIA